MKNIILKILLIILIILALVLTYIKFFYKFDTSNALNNSKEDLDKLYTYHSYKRETFDVNDTIIEESNNTNYVIKLNKKNLTICALDSEECLDFDYKIYENQFVMKTINETIKEARLEFYDINNEIQVIKKYESTEDGYTIFHFKKI